MGRKAMSQALEMPWPFKANVSRDSSCSDAESKMTTPAGPDQGPAFLVVLPPFSPTALRLSVDCSVKAHLATSPCAYSGHCRVGKHRAEQRCTSRAWSPG